MAAETRTSADWAGVRGTGLRGERGREERQAHVVPVGNVHVAVVEFLVLVADPQRVQLSLQLARSQLQEEFILGAAVQEQEPHSPKRVRVAVDEADRIVLQPTLPDRV